MDIKDFYYEKVFTKKIRYDKKLKYLINQLKKIKYSSENHKRLLSYDIFAYPKFKIKNGVNFFKDMNEIEGISILKTKFIMSNLIEKYIVFSDKKLISSRNLTTNDEKKFHDIITNSSSFDEKNNFLSKLMFCTANEQMIFQDRNLEQYFYRMITIFKSCDKTRKLIKEEIGLELEEILLFYWLILSYVIQSNNIILDFKISNFKQYVLNADFMNKILEDKIENFLNFILIDIDKFTMKYESFRKKGDVFLDYDKLNQIDKYLPKISFHYPFIKISDDVFRLVSYTALNQFMHMENLFYFIAEQKKDNYKSKIFGPLLEKYITLLVKEFSIYHHAKLVIYNYDKKDQEYIIGKNKYDLPDVIVESDEYVIFIESKVSAFNLKNALIDFSKTSFSNTLEAIEKSQKNINRFLQYNPLNLENLEKKKIYKFICFNVINSTMLSTLKYSDFLELDDLYLTDLQSLEALFNIINESNLDVILDKFKIYHEDSSKGNSIYHFCIDEYQINYEKFQRTQDEVLKEFFN